MGYDFGFMLLSRREQFPFHPPGDYDGPVPNFENLGTIRDLLLEKGFRPNAILPERPHCYRWNTPDGGHLDVSLSERRIDVDTHAHWKFVHELYEYVRGVYPDLVVADPQTGDLHDRDSFAAFVRASYAKPKT
jgi:hypothetical protein